MRDEGFGRAIGDRPARHLAAAARPDPAGLEQHVDRALRHGDAADVLDLGARHRLVIGDDRERLDRRARQLARLHRLARQQPGEVVRGAERPFAVDAHEIDAARGIFVLQQRQHLLDVDAGRQALRRASSRRAARWRRTAAPRGCAVPPASPAAPDARPAYPRRPLHVCGPSLASFCRSPPRSANFDRTASCLFAFNVVAVTRGSRRHFRILPLRLRI